MSDDFGNYEKDFLNKIKQDKSGNASFFDSNLLNNVHKKVLGKTFRINENNQKQQKNDSVNNKAQTVINSDKFVRKYVQDLYVALKQLGDKEIAKQLIFEHIMMLNEIFKEFED
ncbi:MAG TPA: hypothetical protein PLO89_00435 [Spirochaetota bacterium]|nr:hypothetical protein [Spirochaetota bacterium]